MARADGARADRVVLFKSMRRLLLFRGEILLVSYQVALGGSPTGQKLSQDDDRTPEGTYRLDWRSAQSDYHRAIHISYPSSEDLARARLAGVPPGGDVMLHGLPTGLAEIGSAHLAGDWTDGCIAVTNLEIEQIWQLVEVGTSIEIFP